MLPSIRLIAATFFCGFVVVFAGLRIAASLNDIHEGLPVMAAQAAPIQAAPNANPAMRRGQSAVPVIYDLRFVAANTGFTPTLASLAPAPPLDITPPAIERVTREELPAPAGSTVASAKDDGPVEAAEPAPAPAPVESPAPAVEAVPSTPSEP
jgi:hypothetical protein